MYFTSNLVVLFCVLLTLAFEMSQLQAQSKMVLLGFDDFDNAANIGASQNADADNVAAGFSGSITYTDSGVTDVKWANGGADLGSNSGLFGAYPGIVADTANTTTKAHLMTPYHIQDTSALSLEFTIENNSGSAYQLTNFVFDVYNPQHNSPDGVELLYGGSSLGVVNFPALHAGVNDTGEPHPGVEGVEGVRNYATIDLALSGGMTLEHGQSYDFELDVKDGGTNAHYLNARAYFDNFGFIGTVVPEPSHSPLILGIGSLFSLMVLRRF